MPRFRLPRTTPRITGTKSKHDHDALDLIETARVKVNKARVRLPYFLEPDDQERVLRAIQTLQDDTALLFTSAVTATLTP